MTKLKSGLLAVGLFAFLAAASHDVEAASNQKPVDTPGVKRSGSQTLHMRCAAKHASENVKQQDGGDLVIPEGFLLGKGGFKKQGSNWALFYCNYGPASSAPPIPYYTVYYEMTGYKADECKIMDGAIFCMK